MQAVESWNSIKAKMCHKHLSFQKSFRIKCIQAIEKWNVGTGWYQILEEQLFLQQQKEKSSEQLGCEKILKNDELQRLKAKGRTARVKPKDTCARNPFGVSSANIPA